MQQILLFVLLGLGSGALIAGIALAVVLTYRGSGIINLATGAVAMLSGYAYWSLRSGEYGGAHFATAPALLLTLVITLIIGTLMELVAFRPLRNASPLAKLVSSLGVLLIAQASMLLAFGTTQKPEPSDAAERHREGLRLDMPEDRFILAGIVDRARDRADARLPLHALRPRHAGRRRRTSCRRCSAGCRPTSCRWPTRCSPASWPARSACSRASITQLDTVSLPLQVVPALAAALLARLTSFWIACAAGLGIGIINSLIDYFSTKTWFPTDHGVPLPGVKELIAFLIIVAAMFLRGGEHCRVAASWSSSGCRRSRGPSNLIAARGRLRRSSARSR